jgi:hypothetical protein
MTDAQLRARVAELVGEGYGGDKIKAALRRSDHTVIELWAEERARADGVLDSVEPTPANVVRVRETYKFGPDRDANRKPRWELVAAVVYGDASPENCKKVHALYERERGPGSARASYAGRGTRA